MSLVQSAWWSEFCARVGSEPLEELAARYRVSEADAIAALLEASAVEGSVLEAPWWPEAVRRLKGGASLRELSRVFGANLRRLRRGLARAGVRVAGQDLGDDGLSTLADFRDRLGTMPDSEIAELAGVSVEAVQGERRRFNVEPFRAALAPVAAPVVAPVAAPVVVAPPSARVEAPREPVRPSRGDGPVTRTRHAGATPRAADAPAWEPPPRAADAPSRSPELERPRRFNERGGEPERRPPPRDALEGGRRWSWDEPDEMGGEPKDRGFAPNRGTRVWRRTDTPEPTVIRRPRLAGRVADVGRETVPSADDGGFVRSADATDDALNQASVDAANRERRGRLRLVRPDAPAAPEPVVEAAQPRVVRRRREPTYSPVRVVEVDEQLRATLEKEMELEAPASPPPAREIETPVLALPELDATPLHLPPAADQHDVPVPVEPRPLSFYTDTIDELEPLPVAPAPRPRGPAPRAPRRVETTSPPPSVRPQPVTRRFGWLVHIEGRPAPLLVVAPDILSATTIAASTVGTELLGRASIVMLGPELL